MMLSISDARPKFVAQLHPAPVRASELRALYDPSFKTGRTLLNTSGGVAALGVATIMFGGIGIELAVVVAVCTTFTVSGVGIGALMMMFGDGTCTQGNIRRLCDYCHTHHPGEFATFLRFSNLSRIVEVNCDSVGDGSKQEQKDSAILDSIIGFLNSDVFTTTERAEAARHIRVCGGYGYDLMRNIATRTVIDYLISTGTTEPFIELADNIQFTFARNAHSSSLNIKYAAVANESTTKILRIISRMPNDLAVEILNSICTTYGYAQCNVSFAMKVVRNCKNPEVVNLLLASLQQFPEEQRNEVLA
ncbi:MAG: hypothetical protein LBI34_03145, partial [Puniceicoccales bacterium]|nr:hypothetical protein [Puniceicoccales bacterium]